MPAPQKTCFCIIPFGRRKVGQRMVDFDRLFRESIAPTVESQGYRCLRSDQASDHGGSLHQRMFELILSADLVLADLSGLNANVFYELGVRHALVSSVTLMIRQEQDRLPFDVGHFEVQRYALGMDRLLTRKSQKDLKERIRSAGRAAAAKADYSDSPVHKELPIDIRLRDDPVGPADSVRYGFYSSDSCTLKIVNDELLNIRNVDLWVNSENTHLQMARPLERSVSAAIRYSGARVRQGRIIEDQIQDELNSKHRGPVAEGTVFLTGAGRLEATHRVAGILHVAAVAGKPMKGFSVSADIPLCVRNVLEFADKYCRKTHLESLLLPLLGTGQGRGHMERSAFAILNTVLAWFAANPSSSLQEISVLAQGPRAYKFCTEFLDNHKEVKRLQ